MSTSQGNKSGTSRVQALLEQAHEEGTLSTSAFQALAIPDLGAQIQAGLGVSVDDVEASEVVLCTLMPDDSGSIAASGNEAAVRDGHNLVLDALRASRQKDGLLVHTRYLNGNVLNPYCPIEHAQPMTAANYEASRGTPLYDQSLVLLGTVVTKSQELAEAGVPVRTVTLIITDGADEHSTRATASTVAALVADMQRSERHIVAAMGIDGGHTDFRQVFREMGIADRWILTPRSQPSEIRRAFVVFSQSALQLGQGAASFSRATLGGFTN